MKKRTLKNIFTSICVTSLVVMILIMVGGVILDNMFKKAVLSDVNDYIQIQNMEAGIEEDLKSFEGENGSTMYATRTIEIIFRAKSLVYADMLYGLIISVILGSIIGILRTVMESRQDKKAVTKKAIIVFFIGLVVLEAMAIIVDAIRNNLDIELYVVLAIIYTVVYLAIFLVKLRIDKHKKNKLNELVKNYKDTNN